MKNSDEIVPYEVLLLAIDSSNCFNEAFDLMSDMNVVRNFENVHRDSSNCFNEALDLKSDMNVVRNFENVHRLLSLTIKSQLVCGFFSPRMFEGLPLVAETQSDMANQNLVNSHFRLRERVDMGEIHQPFRISSTVSYRKGSISPIFERVCSFNKRCFDDNARQKTTIK